jgi:hypothetical protein
VERFLGEGAFAEVYRVQHRFLGRQAMKVLKTPGMTIGEIEQMLGIRTLSGSSTRTPLIFPAASSGSSRWSTWLAAALIGSGGPTATT